MQHRRFSSVSDDDRNPYRRVTAYAADPGARARLKAFASTCSDVALVNDWRELARPSVSRMIVAPDLNDAVVNGTRHLRESDPFTPLIIVTRFEVMNLVHLAGATADHVVSYDEPFTEWSAAVAATVRDEEYREFATRVRASEHIPELLRIALIRLAMAEPPFRTVRALGRSLGYGPSTLRTQFAKLNTGYRLEDIVHLFVLLRYGWPQNAPAISTSDIRPGARTLDRLAQRLLGQRRRDLSRPCLVEVDFVRKVLER